MRLAKILTVFRKELRDMLRDRRTIFGAVVLPVALIPVMMIGMTALEKEMEQRVKRESVRIMLLGADNAPALAARIREAEGFEVVPAAPDYAERISGKRLRAAVEFPAGFEQAIRTGREPLTLKIHYYSTEIRSEATVRRLEDVIRTYRDEVVEGRLAARGLPATILKPVQARTQNVASEEKVGGLKLAGLMPYLIILLALTGALHPAMDLTAGEKERGTLETILASAVRRSELVLGKFLLVLVVSLTTAFLSLASFGLSVRFAGDFSEEMTRGYGYQVSLTAVASVFLLVLPLAVLFAAVLLTVALFAKSYKEAQSYTGPLIVVAIFPAVMSLMPGVELTPKLALVPIVNVSLLCREIFTGNFPWDSIALVFLSTCAYAAAALFVAVRQFYREEVLFRA